MLRGGVACAAADKFVPKWLNEWLISATYPVDSSCCSVVAALQKLGELAGCKHTSKHSKILIDSRACLTARARRTARRPLLASGDAVDAAPLRLRSATHDDLP